MKKIAYVGFVCNLLLLIIYFFGIPLSFFFDKNFIIEIFLEDKGMNTYKTLYMVLVLGTFFNWIYCIHFLYKNDKYSKSALPLIFFNGLYAPIYFYRVIIKKRPLRNKIEYEKTDQTPNYEIEQLSYKERIRKNVFDVIEMWTSAESQIEYQLNVPIADVSAEIFCQWDDSYHPDSDEHFNRFFENRELKLLAEFDKALNSISNKSTKRLPSIEKYVKTDDWKFLNKKAIEIDKKIKVVANKIYSK